MALCSLGSNGDAVSCEITKRRGCIIHLGDVPVSSNHHLANRFRKTGRNFVTLLRFTYWVQNEVPVCVQMNLTFILMLFGSGRVVLITFKYGRNRGYRHAKCSSPCSGLSSRCATSYEARTITRHVFSQNHLVTSSVSSTLPTLVP